MIVVIVIYREGQKQLLEDLLHPKSTLPRSTIHDQVHSKGLPTTSLRNQEGVMEPCWRFLFVQPDKKMLD